MGVRVTIAAVCAAFAMVNSCKNESKLDRMEDKIERVASQRDIEDLRRELREIKDQRVPAGL